MSYQLAAYIDPPETLRLLFADSASLRSLLDLLQEADSSITYRPDLSALLISTDDGTAFYSLVYPDGPGAARASLVCCLVTQADSINDAAAACAAARSKLRAVLRLALNGDPSLGASIQLPP